MRNLSESPLLFSHFELFRGRKQLTKWGSQTRLSETLGYVKNQIKQLLIIRDCQRKIKPELLLQNKKAISYFLMLFLRDVPQENK